MPDIKLVRLHSLPLPKAKALAQKAADALAGEYDVTSEWRGNTLRFHRSGVDGQMRVTDSQIELEVKLGFLLKAFKARIASHIERNLDALLADEKKPAKKPARCK
ncbi:MAG: polyhydroxyalkanoic acid system family protein [Burkholderiaceae bacterium]